MGGRTARVDVPSARSPCREPVREASLPWCKWLQKVPKRTFTLLLSPIRVYVPGPRAMEGTNPVNKKLAAALSGGAVLVLALSGCTDESNDKLNNWAKSVCDAVQPQAKK